MRVLLLLSGGEDSAHALESLLDKNNSVTALCIHGNQGIEKIGAEKTARKFNTTLIIEPISNFDETTYNPFKLICRDFKMFRRTLKTAIELDVDAIATGFKKKDLLQPQLFIWIIPFIVLATIYTRLLGFKIIYPSWNLKT
jgi:tRNA(Ile)-lysidine synthase TilS/MesJ